MNRQLRRAQDKQDKKQEKEKAKRRQDRRSRVQRLRASRQRARPVKNDGDQGRSGSSSPESATGGKAVRGREPGRFSGALALATVFFITLQGAYPDPERSTVTSLVSAGFYLMLGYFGVLWLMRRGTERPFVLAVAGGAVLALSTSVAAVLQDRGLDPLLLALVLPALAAGAYLGRLVYVHTPR